MIKVRAGSTCPLVLLDHIIQRNINEFIVQYCLGLESGSLLSWAECLPVQPLC